MKQLKLLFIYIRSKLRQILLIFVNSIEKEMPKGIVFILIIASLLISLYLDAQKVTVSREIGIRNNYSYDVLPNIVDNIIFYHDKGIEHSFEIYDNNLRYKNTIQLDLEKKNIQPTGVLPMDSTFRFYYSYKDEDKVYFRVNVYDENVSLKDSSTLSVKDKKIINSNPRFAFSKDKSKVLIFTPDDKNLHLQLVNNITLKLIFDFTLMVKNVNLKSDFEELLVTNSGEIYLLARKSSFWDRKDADGFTLIRIKDQSNILMHHFTPEKDKISDLLMNYDEKNVRLALGGFITENDESKATGYFGFSINGDAMPEEAEILVNKFSPDFISEVTGKKTGKAKEISDYRIKDILVRNDGGVIIISELVKEFTRRTQMIAPNQFGDYFPARGLVDYYHEDIILLSTFPDGKEHWRKILFKKQFSQDDNGIYSSYFVFKTPSRIRLIYNDEIKNSNTVSEYVFDPLGQFERKSVLSTDYQNLKLRFRDAIQIGPSNLLVPSEKNSKINLVRIDYD